MLLGDDPEVLVVGNCSGFYGDRVDALVEMLEGGALDVLTGDYLAELTMLILWRDRARDASRGYARTFLRQMRDGLRLAVERDVRIVVNAGGLAPQALAAALRELAADQGVDVDVAHVVGDDLAGRVPSLLDDGHELRHLDTGEAFADLSAPALTANAYLGGFGIAAALEAGARVVVTGRVTDAALVVGPCVAHFGWTHDDLDPLAGAVVAGHVVECGCQATGGNLSSFDELLDTGVDLTRPGFPIAEVHHDGSSVITKHPRTGGAVTRDTVTAQLLYEVQGPAYANPDVVARLDTVALSDDGPDRVRVAGVRGEAPPVDLKMAVTTLGGHRNRVSFVLTGLDRDRKAALVEAQLRSALDLDAITDGGSLTFDLRRTAVEDPATNVAATSLLDVTARHPDPDVVGRSFSNACVGLALASYPGCTMTAPPGGAEPYGRYWPTTVPRSVVAQEVVLADDRVLDVADPWARATNDPAAGRAQPSRPAATPSNGEVDTWTVTGPPSSSDDRHATGSTRDPVATERTGPVESPPGVSDAVRVLPDGTPLVRAPLGRVVRARSGDKGGNANIGVWVTTDAAWSWLRGFLTVEQVRQLLPESEGLRIDRHEMANLRAINLVLHGLLGDGVASSVRPDPQAKGLGEWLRARVVDIPVDLLGADAR